MALATLRHSAATAGRFLPSGATLFLRRRAMEIVGLALILVGLAALIALVTYHSTDPSLNRATGFAPRNLLGVAGATFADLMMQSLGLGSLLVPAAVVAWGVMLMRRHALPFFGVRLALLLLATLLGASAAAALDAIGHWTPHAGPGGVTGAALAARFREVTLTYSDGWLLDFLAPLSAVLAVLLMVPVVGMKRGHLPIALRVVLLPLTLGRMLLRAGISVWRGRPERDAPEAEAPQPAIGYAEVPGEIDASQYDPARFSGIPEVGMSLPPRDTLLVDAPLSPIADLKPVEPIPPVPPSLDIPAMAPRTVATSPAWLPPFLARLLGQSQQAMRVEPVFGQAPPGSALAGDVPDNSPAALPDVDGDETPRSPASARILHLRRRTPDAGAETQQAASAVVPPKVVKRASPQPGRRAEAERQKRLALTQEFQLPALDILAAAPKSAAAAQIDEDALAQNARLLESVLEDFGVKGEIVKVRPGTVATRTLTALMERAMSSARPMTRLDLVPGAGSSS